MIYKNILETIGNTPIVKLDKIIPEGSIHTFWAKLEYFNPGLSVKDRIALALINGAVKRGDLKPGGTIIEATSGNTGMGLALAASVLGYKAIFVMPDKISEEKRAILRAYGAKVVITATAVEPEDPRSYLSVSKKLAEITPNSFLTNQYHNPDNVNVHYTSTGPEVWEQTEGKVDVFVAGAGTGGTVSGVGRYLKEKKPSVKILCPDPVGSILYDLFYHKKVVNPPKPYKVEGVGEDMLPDNTHLDVIDDFVRVDDQESFALTREIVAKEGICVGPSSAMALAGAIKYSETLTEPHNFLIMMADSGRSYLSKAFNEDWLRDNEFLPSPMKSATTLDLVQKRGGKGNLISAKVGHTVLEVVNLLKEHNISQVPVYSDKEIVGILDESDLILPLAAGKLKPDEPIIHLVKGTLVWVDPTDNLDSLSQHLQHGYVALMKMHDGSVELITKIDLLEFMGTYSSSTCLWARLRRNLQIPSPICHKLASQKAEISNKIGINLGVDMNWNQKGFSTKAIHAGQVPDPTTGAIMTPLYLSSTFVQSSPGVHKGWEYSRSQNPTRKAYEDCLASLEGGKHGFGMASGCAAMSTVMHLLKTGDHVVASDDLYGGTFRLFDKVFRDSGIEFSYVDMAEPQKVSEALTEKTKMLWIETPTNPMLKLVDIKVISGLVVGKDIITVVDNTFMSPFLQTPLQLGADIVVHSTTKFINGHSDIVGGAIITSSDDIAERLAFLSKSIGAICGPFDAYMCLRSLKTLSVRMKAHQENAVQIADFLDQHPKVEKVIYPGLKSHPQYALAQKQMSGPGGMITFYVKDLAAARSFLEKVQVFALAESLGGVESLVEHPAIMTHASVPEEMRKKLGIEDGLIRLSVGIEDIADLRADLEQALA